MAIGTGEVRPHFSQPVRQIMTMLVILATVGFGSYIAYPRVAPVFLANPFLNGVILLVFVIGVLACFWQVIQLFSAVNWIEGFATKRPGIEMTRVPGLLTPMAPLLRDTGGRLQIPASATRSILDSVAIRMDEARDITRYVINLLIFLGLLGTFYGLATTVPAVVDTIRTLNPRPGEDTMQVFSRLMSGLEHQLGGMGTAFASSLLGLAGSLVVGLLELFAGHGQNRFYRELEDWLSTITRVGIPAGDGEGGGATLAAGFERVVTQLDEMRDLIAHAEAGRAALEERLGLLAESIARLGERIEAPVTAQLAALDRIADGQERLISTIVETRHDGGGVDAESRMRLRSIDVQLLRLFEEVASGREEAVNEIRADLATMTRLLRDIAKRGGADGNGG
ncbi:MAG: biopolymer transporter ExbB [Alphaproteobacteria bacterium]|nr:MAG: biopolymer transporter ExbB [Alphaproteobacteria bacterium]